MNTDATSRSVFMSMRALSSVLPRPGNENTISAIVTEPIIAGTFPARYGIKRGRLDEKMYPEYVPGSGKKRPSPEV